MDKLTEQQKVQKIYDLIGERGLYVSTNFDVFTKKPEEVPVLHGAYKVPLIQPRSRAFASPLLFATLTSLMHHGTMLITGAPGIGKTTSAEFTGHFFTGSHIDDILQAEILGNPQLKTEDVVASLDIHELTKPGGKKVVLPSKFLKCPVKIWDEVNRTPADLVSSAMKLVDIGKAVYQGELLTSPPGVLFATANYADEGTFQLTPPFLDRFDVAVMVTSPQPWDLRDIRARGDEKLNGSLDQLLQIPEELGLDHKAIRSQLKNLPEATEYDDSPVVSRFADFVYAALRFSEIASDSLVRGTKGNAWQIDQQKAPPGHFRDAPFVYTSNELSVRTAKAMTRYAQALAWFKGKEKVELEDLKAVLPYLLWHKVQPTEKALTENPKFANDRIALVEGLVTKIENDYTEMQGSEAWKQYGAAIQALTTGKVKEKDLTEEETRRLVRNAIMRVGNVDKPWALTLASHIASEYNRRFNGK